MKPVRIALAALAALSATATLAATNWLATIDTSGGGHAIGNPKAKVKLAELVSYTCSHCATFQQQAGTALELYVATGKVQLDIRHVIRDRVDLVATMVANCGPAAKFPGNHKRLMLSQGQWLPIVERASAAQQSRWDNGPGPARRRAVASDLKFYELMVPRGYDRVALDRCLSDEAMAARLSAQSVADDKKWGVRATPSFAFNGVMIGVQEWRTLRPIIDEQLKAARL